MAPLTLRDRMEALIHREMENAGSGKTGKIIAKMNSLVDGKMIKLLYQASQAGVEIDLNYPRNLLSADREFQA